MSSAVLPNGTKLNSIEVDSIFALGDINKDGEIDQDEFMAVMLPSAGFSQSFTTSNTQFMKTTSSSSSSFKQTSSSSFQQTSSMSMSSSQSYSSTTKYST